MQKKTLIKMRGGISRLTISFGGALGVLLFLSNLIGGIFLFVLPAVAGGQNGEVIDYTLLEKLQQEYGTTTPQNLRLPQISATTTKFEGKRAGMVGGIKIENNLPVGFVSKSSTSTVSEVKISSTIFALIVLALILWIYWRHKNNGGRKNNGQTPTEDLRQDTLPL